MPLNPLKFVNPFIPGEIYSIPGTSIICLYPTLKKFFTGPLNMCEYSAEKYPVGYEYPYEGINIRGISFVRLK
jgi:hypothetical protein